MGDLIPLQRGETLRLGRKDTYRLPDRVATVDGDRDKRPIGYHRPARSGQRVGLNIPKLAGGALPAA